MLPKKKKKKKTKKLIIGEREKARMNLVVLD